MDDAASVQEGVEASLPAHGRTGQLLAGASQAQICWAWVRMNVLQVCPGGLLARTCLRYFCRVRLATCMPSLSNAPLMRSARDAAGCPFPSPQMLATVCWDILGLRDAALDWYFHKSLKP